jgi:hypothetical protein
MFEFINDAKEKSGNETPAGGKEYMAAQAGNLVGGLVGEVAGVGTAAAVTAVVGLPVAAIGGVAIGLGIIGLGIYELCRDDESDAAKRAAAERARGSR